MAAKMENAAGPEFAKRSLVLHHETGTGCLPSGTYTADSSHHEQATSRTPTNPEASPDNNEHFLAHCSSPPPSHTPL